MKLGNKVSFGVQAVVAGQKSATVNAAPQLICNSTTGKFTITSPVSKAMGVAVGENIMFLNNISGIENAITQRLDDIVAYANEKGIDLDTREGQEAVLKEFTQWFIAKGEPTFDAKGNPVMASQRFTKVEKTEYVNAHADEILANNRAALVERAGDENATDEELKALITIDDIKWPEYHVHSGSKTSSTGTATGVGCQLSFTDTAIWSAIKADLAEEDKVKVNRVFTVDLEAAEKVPYFNGVASVDVLIYPIVFTEDVAPLRRGENA
mgnify:CR=1 FL=1